ncbi:MAG TPA: HAMP domain-containing protein, partial [Gemmatimonadales bacterium]|nr:HAMP domain-containing protein [Gemmatimonadales bacterium]
MSGFSLRTRLTVWYAAALGVTLLVFGVAVARALIGMLSEEFDERLVSAAGVVQFAVRDMMRDLGPDAAAAQLLKQLRFIDVAVAISARPADRPQVEFAGGDTALARAHMPGACHKEPIARRSLHSVTYRLLIDCMPPTPALPELSIVVGAPERELTSQSRRIQGLIALALAIGLALTALGGHWLSGKAIAPIRRMGAQVREIGSENLDQRLPVSSAEGEIAELSVMVNALFDRLAATLGRERQFLANAAHALRTPVA